MESAFAPTPLLCAPYFEQEVIGAAMLDRLAAALFGNAEPAAVLFSGRAQELSVDADGAWLRLSLPLADKGEISLKKIGSELVVSVDGQRRTIALPPAMAQMRAGAAHLNQTASWRSASMPEPAAERSEADALYALQERLDRAAAAAERLLAQAGGGPAVPPRGWQRAGGDRDDGRSARPRADWTEGEDAALLLGLLAGVRERVPAELAQRLAAAVREVLLALRALIDWCLERAERRRTTPVEVQDIPIL